MITTSFIDFDASNDYCHVGAGNGTDYEGFVLDTRVTTGGHRWSDDEWTGRVDLHLRMADKIARILGVYVRYNQLWCEQRARTIGAFHVVPTPEPHVDTIAVDTIADILNEHDQWSSDEIEDVARVLECVRGRRPGTDDYIHGDRLLTEDRGRYQLSE